MQFEYYKNILSISNYRQIQQMDSDLIALENIKVYGQDFKILKLDKDCIVIKGVINKIEMGDG